jgi:hypothetical protein
MILGFRDEVEVRERLSGRDVAAYLRGKQGLLEMLLPRDRLLLELGATGDRSIREVSRMVGASPGLMSRRLRSVWKRLHDPLVAHLVEKACPLSAEMRQVGVERHLLGMPPGEIAEKHGMTPAEVRGMLAFLKGYARGRGFSVVEEVRVTRRTNGGSDEGDKNEAERSGPRAHRGPRRVLGTEVAQRRPA